MTIRTSLTHPLHIASVSAGEGMGRIGVTLCPGKHQASAFTGAWQRDLGVDLDAIAAWGAGVVVTLVEPHELDALKVSAMGQEVARRHMAWVHLPIPDVSVPDERFEQQWAVFGEGLRQVLRSGFDVLVHCKGGLGRAGTIAARLLAELGWEPSQAIAAVRAVRPGAIETAAQQRHVLAAQVVPEPLPARSSAAVRDRAVGALVGLAVGDAVGTTLEFTTRDSYPPLTDMVGGGPFKLEPGQWTDGTAMALALAESLIAEPWLNARDLMTRFCSWRRQGTYSCTGTCFDIGVTVSSALARFERSGDPIAGSPDPMSAGNGALMRLAPVAIRHWSNRAVLTDTAIRQSATTYGAPEALAASVAFAAMLADAIEGQPRSAVLRPRDGGYAGRIGAIVAGSWRGKPRHVIRASGYVAHSLEAALWAIGRTADFRSAILTAANLGEDADTTAAITGQLAGALYGASRIPPEWLDRLAWKDKTAGVAERLLEAANSSNQASQPVALAFKSSGHDGRRSLPSTQERAPPPQEGSASTSSQACVDTRTAHRSDSSAGYSATPSTLRSIAKTWCGAFPRDARAQSASREHHDAPTPGPLSQLAASDTSDPNIGHITTDGCRPDAAWHPRTRGTQKVRNSAPLGRLDLV